MSTAPRDQSALLWNATPKVRTKTRHPREPLWTLTKAGGRWSAELIGHGEHGWELQLLRDEDFRYGQRHVLRAQAIGEADHWRRELEAKGWTDLSLPA